MKKEYRYERGDGVVQFLDGYHTAAFCHFLRGADTFDDARSAFFVGYLYEFGIGVSQNYENAYEYFISCQDDDEGEAAYNLIEPVQNGEITGLTLEKLMEYARDGAIRSDYNAAAARAVIAQIQDEEYYFGYFEEAAKMGHVESAELLAQAYGEEEEYEAEFKWNEIAVRNCIRQKAPIDSEIAASVIAALANGRGTAKDEYQAFRKVIEFLSYEYNYHNEEMLEYFEQCNPEIRDLLNHMAQLTRDGDAVAADLWKEFEEVCSGPAVESPRTLEDYLE
jgi:TPR repeat protein